MRTLIIIVIGITISVLAANAGTDTLSMLTNVDFPSSLSGTTSTGFDFAEVPRTATYGLLGAGFLVLTVLRRRKHIYRINKTKV
jgi:hypothetical protein